MSMKYLLSDVKRQKTNRSFAQIMQVNTMEVKIISLYIKKKSPKDDWGLQIRSLQVFCRPTVKSLTNGTSSLDVQVRSHDWLECGH